MINISFHIEGLQVGQN